MASNILSIGKSALAAAQAGLATTGHNIANASTPGYSRQVVVQSAVQPQDFGYGFVGQGTQISAVKRVYSDFLSRQVVAAQSSKSELDSYYAQIRHINNLLADSSTGLAPAVQEFFNGLHDLASNPSSIASRQVVLAAGEALADRFQLLAGRIDETHRCLRDRTALLVVDMQYGFLEPGASLEVPKGHTIIPRLRRLIAACRAAGVPVMFTQFVYSAAVPCLRGNPFGIEHLPPLAGQSTGYGYPSGNCLVGPDAGPGPESRDIIPELAPLSRTGAAVR